MFVSLIFWLIGTLSTDDWNATNLASGQ
jgi:hypothetical protein